LCAHRRRFVCARAHRKELVCARAQNRLLCAHAEKILCAHAQRKKELLCAHTEKMVWVCSRREEFLCARGTNYCVRTQKETFVRTRRKEPMLTVLWRYLGARIKNIKTHESRARAYAHTEKLPFIVGCDMISSMGKIEDGATTVILGYTGLID
jgi:hypothetical protein